MIFIVADMWGWFDEVVIIDNDLVTIMIPLEESLALHTWHATKEAWIFTTVLQLSPRSPHYKFIHVSTAFIIFHSHSSLIAIVITSLMIHVMFWQRMPLWQHIMFFQHMTFWPHNMFWQRSISKLSKFRFKLLVSSFPLQGFSFQPVKFHFYHPESNVVDTRVSSNSFRLHKRNICLIRVT